MKVSRFARATAGPLIVALLLGLAVASGGCSLLSQTRDSGETKGSTVTKTSDDKDRAEPEADWLRTLRTRLEKEPGFVYCAAGGKKDVVARIKGTTEKRDAQWPVPHSIQNVALKPDGSELWCTPLGWDTLRGMLDKPLLILDPASGEVKDTIDARHSGQVAFTPDGKKAYVTMTGGSEVAVYDAATHARLKSIAVGKHPLGISISFDGKRAYVSHVSAVVGRKSVQKIPGQSVTLSIPKLENGSEFVAVIDLATDAVIKRIPLDGFGSDVAVSPDGALVYATVSSIDVNRVGTQAASGGGGGRWDGVAAIDTASLKVTKKIAFEPRSGPKAVAFTPDGTKAYTICGASDLAVPIKVAGHTRMKGIPLDLGG